MPDYRNLTPPNSGRLLAAESSHWIRMHDRPAAAVAHARNPGAASDRLYRNEFNAPMESSMISKWIERFAVAAAAAGTVVPAANTTCRRRKPLSRKKSTICTR